MNSIEDQKLYAKIVLNLMVRTIGWVMAIVSAITAVLSFLATFRIFTMRRFDEPKTLIYVLMITFGVWTLRCYIDSKIYPTYKYYTYGFLILTAIAGYLMTRNII